MAQCPRFPKKVVRELLEKTAETGNEHGAVICGDGSVTKIVSGGKTGMNIGKALRECNGEDGHQIIHTHPNGAKRLSKQDREVAADEDIESVCVAVEGGETICESVDSCEVEYEI